ncbi:MAG: GNAT family protein [Candidatus Hydrogenedentes bacterium]|nr:GNAT family protein [Candidatus Hydrogenedentota bacterium]
MRYFKKLLGKKCYLSPMTVDDAEQFTEWLNDLEVISNLGASAEPITVAGERKKLEELGDKHVYAIVDLETDKLIGSTGLNNIHETHRCCSLGIMIGDKSYHGKAYGREAIGLLLGLAFNFLNMHNVLLWVYEDNARGIACYKSVGFKECGRRRQANRLNGNWRDIIFMDILEEEFAAQQAGA